jgi:hypothetical protein
MQRSRGQAILGYALVAAILGIAMLAAMGFTRQAAGNNIVTTQVRLSNEVNAP